MEEFKDDGDNAFGIVTDETGRLAVNVYNGKKICEMKAGQLIKLIGKFKEMKNGKVQFEVYGIHNVIHLSGDNLPLESLGKIVKTSKRKRTSEMLTPISKVKF